MLADLVTHTHTYNSNKNTIFIKPNEILYI